MTMAQTHTLDASQVHHEWNNAIPPRLTIDPGDTVVFDTRDAADGFYTQKSTAADVMRRWEADRFVRPAARAASWPSRPGSGSCYRQSSLASTYHQ